MQPEPKTTTIIDKIRYNFGYEMRLVTVLFFILFAVQAFSNSTPESPAARNRNDTAENVKKSPACPVTNPLCNNPPEKESSTEAPTTRSKNQTWKNETSNPPCPVSNPNCNQTWKNQNSSPTCPVSNPNCNEPAKK
jgi:hypothetical protein